MNASSCTLPGSQFFDSSGVFTVPPGVTSVSVLLVGGGMGGTSSDTTGGSGGYVNCGTFNVPIGGTVPVVVGAGSPALLSGGNSSFGSYLQAAGGDYDNYHYSDGYNGGTGSGARWFLPFV